MPALRPLLALSVAITAAVGARAGEQAPQRLRERLPDRPSAQSPRTLNAPMAQAVGGAAGDTAQDAPSTSLIEPKQIVVEGSVAVSPDALEPILLRYQRRPLTRSDLARLAREITDLYRGLGFFLTRAVIPPQNLDTGVLTVSIEEGRFVEVTFDGDKEGELAEYFEILLAEAPARRESLERALLTIKDLAGIHVESSRAVPIPNRRGEYRLALKIARRKLDGYVHLDNRGEGGGTALQVSGEAAANSVAVLGDRMGAGVFFEPDDPTAKVFGEVSYAAPLGLRGTIVAASLSGSRAQDGQKGSGQFKSVGGEVTVALSHPVLRSQEHSLWLNIEVVQANSESTLDGVVAEKDELSVVRAGVDYELRDAWNGRNQLRLDVSLGRDQFKPPSPLHPAARQDDAASFTKLSLFASRTQTFNEAWSIHAAMRSQWSADDLPGIELISFGGARLGRAYDYGEIDGDTGIGGLLEIRYGREFEGFVESLQAYAFGDAAATWVRSGEGTPAHLASAGLGLRAYLGDGLRAGVEAVMPLTRTPDGENGRDPRMFATFAKEF